MPAPATVDFETEGIEPRPTYPPKPCGVALWVPGEAPRYMAFAHDTGNNATEGQARETLERVYRERPVLFWNGKFDLDVGETHLGLLPQREVLDSMVEAFLALPHRFSLGLKEVANDELGDPPDEQDALKAWILVNVPGAKKKKKEWKKHIARAPGRLAGKYAVDDVVKTRRLHDHFMRGEVGAEMGDALEREMRLLPIMLRAEREGVRIDCERLERDAARWARDLERVDRWLRKKLRVGESMNLDSDEQLADAFERAGLVKEWIVTAKGRRSVKVAALDEVLETPLGRKILNVLRYRARMEVSLNTFARPWLEQAARTGGTVHPQWHATRGDVGKGARTGRFSSTPNFQNIPKTPEIVVRWSDPRRGQHGFLAIPDELEVGQLPNLRDYVLPDSEHEVLLDRDYNQQELRILAHFESGTLMEDYLANPWLDMHATARDRIHSAFGINFSRRAMKTINFGLIYGMGVGKLARAIGEETKVARSAKKALLSIYPGLQALIRSLRERADANAPIRTWGGRLYRKELPVVGDDGRIWTFEYKLINTLIQGSAADCTKEAIVRYDEARKHGKLRLTVHDEIAVSCPRRAAPREMKILRECMESVEFDVPMLSEGKTSATSWAKLEDFDDGREKRNAA